MVTGRAALGGAGGPEAAPRNRADAREAAPRVVVRPGDTLWEIARAVVGSEGDPRPLVERIREANGIASSEPLLPGTSLVVPAR